MKRKEIRERLDVLNIEMDNAIKEGRRKDADKEALAERKEKIRAERRILNKKLRRRELLKYNWPVILVLLGIGGYITGSVLMATQAQVMPGAVVLGAGVWMVIVGAIVEVLRDDLG